MGDPCFLTLLLLEHLGWPVVALAAAEREGQLGGTLPASLSPVDGLVRGSKLDVNSSVCMFTNVGF